MVAKVLEHIMGHSYQAKKWHSGDLLVEIPTKAQSTELNKFSKPVSPSMEIHQKKIDANETNILEGLQSSSVTAVKRIVFRRDGRDIPSKHLILTFDLRSLPATVKAGYLNCRVRWYVSKPQMCFKCQRPGHGPRNFGGKEISAKCGSNEHVTDICENALRSSNCKVARAAYSRVCRLWIQGKNILSLKVKENLSYLEAKKR